MDAKLVWNTTVDYADVDRDEALLLTGVFKLLQEAAIRHANQFDTGTRAMLTRGESWVLNRLSVEVRQYPRYDDALRIETWSSRLNGFRGYREYRICRGEELLAQGSALWLYLNLTTKSLVRVPPEIASIFPTFPGTAYQPDLDRLATPSPAAPAHRQVVSLRYGDVDGNGHVNNTAYFDYLQTALTRTGLPARPRLVQIKFAKEIRPDTADVTVALEPRANDTVFGILSGDTLHAHGVVQGSDVEGSTASAGQRA